MKTFISLFLAMLSLTAFAQEKLFELTQSSGVETAYAFEKTNKGDIIYAYGSNGKTDFLKTEIPLINENNQVIITSINKDNELNWFQTIYNDSLKGGVRCTDVFVDDGFIYVLGFGNGRLKINNSQIYSNGARSFSFLLKLNLNGKIIYFKKLGSGMLFKKGQADLVDGNLLIAGTNISLSKKWFDGKERHEGNAFYALYDTSGIINKVLPIFFGTNTTLPNAVRIDSIEKRFYVAIQNKDANYQIEDEKIPQGNFTVVTFDYNLSYVASMAVEISGYSFNSQSRISNLAYSSDNIYFIGTNGAEAVLGSFNKKTDNLNYEIIRSYNSIKPILIESLSITDTLIGLMIKTDTAIIYNDSILNSGSTANLVEVKVLVLNTNLKLKTHSWFYTPNYLSSGNDILVGDSSFLMAATIGIASAGGNKFYINNKEVATMQYNSGALLANISTKKVFEKDTANSIQTFEQIAELSIYPNPATSTLNISGHANGSVFIYNSLGRLVLTIEKQTETQELNLSSFRPGMYFLSMNGNVKDFFIE